MNNRLLVLSLAFTGFALHGTGHAAVISNPTLYTGANAIDPVGGETASLFAGATDQSVLEALPNFAAIQDFNNFSSTATVTDYVSFTDPNRADVKYTATARSALLSSSGQATSVNLNASGESLRVQSNGSVYTIEFGNYDVGSATFTQGGANLPTGVGFTIANMSNTMGYLVDFYNAAGTMVISAQYATGHANDADRQFGHKVTTGSIGKVVITLNGSGTGAAGLDDIGFNAIPEPASLSLLSLSCLTMLRRTRRVG